MSVKYISTAFLITLLLVSSCGDKDKSGKPLDTPTYGNIKIAVDESLRPVVEAEIKAFQGIYTNATISASYTSEAEAIDLLLKDSVRMVVITRKLDAAENNVLVAEKLTQKTLVIAHEGIAFIMNPSKRDSLLSPDQVKDIFAGEISRWDQLFKGNSTDSLKIVFDNPSSGILRYLKDTLSLKELPANCYAVNSNPAVVDYVAQNKNALGLIGASWISDTDDSATNQFLKSIRVVGIKNDTSFYQPYQAYIAQKKYPFAREVIVVSREARMGLATGFTQFVASEKGQRVVLKAGLVPATMPVRIVQISKEPIDY